MPEEWRIQKSYRHALSIRHPWYTTHTSCSILSVLLGEAEEYRAACLSWLGLEAESVEEAKACPMFREWLQGNTDGAQHWRSFLALNGGLAPRLSRQLTT